MAESINVTDLAVKVSSALTAADQIMVFDQTGDTNRTPLFDAVAKANGENGQSVIKLHSQNIAAADMLTANATPIAVGITRAAGETVTPMFPIVATVVFNSVAFATNTVLGLRYVGADQPIATCDILARTATGTVLFNPITSVGAAESQFLGDTDLEIYVLTGNPTAGDSVTNVSFQYNVRS